MRIAIIGSRSINDPSHVFSHVSRFIKDHTFGSVVLISGGATGVDSLAKEYAKSHGLDFIEFLPYFKLSKGEKFDAKDFFIRNYQIIDNCDKVLAFWDGESKGTRHALDYALNTGKPVLIIT